MNHDNCPTCGTKLGPLRDHDRVRRCDACRRPNPKGFNYCGFCAAPMENTALRAKMSELAAPPGGWPSLARELIEVKFFMDRGELSEAFEMVQVLRQRWPGHPELRELHDLTPSSRPKKIHTQVNRVVDAVLANSADWNDKPVRRAAPRWQAPAEAGGDGRTQGHVAVPPGTGHIDEDAKTLAPPGGGVNKRVHAPESPRLTRRGHQVPGPFPVIPVINPSFRDAAEAEAAQTETAGGKTGRQPVVAVPPVRVPERKTGKQRPTTGGRKVAKTPTGKGKAAAPPSRKVVADPQWGTPRGHTIAVDALQPASPFATAVEEEDDVDTVRQRADDGTNAPPRRKKSAKKKDRAPSKRGRPAADDSPESEDKRKDQARRRAAKFGQNILGR